MRIRHSFTIGEFVTTLAGTHKTIDNISHYNKHYAITSRIGIIIGFDDQNNALLLTSDGVQFINVVLITKIND